MAVTSQRSLTTPADTPLTPERQARFFRLAVTSLGATIAVILWGAYVRISGSGAGCGSHWPTCNGEVIPHPKSIATLIEVTHRLTSGALSLLIAAQTLLGIRWFPRGHRARGAAVASAVLLVTEAALGAGLVVFEKVAKDTSLGRAGWSAAHLVNTFLLVAFTALTAFWTRVPPRGRLGRAQRIELGAALVGMLVVGVAGTIAALGDTLFPAKSLVEGFAQDLSPTAHFLLRLRVLHPIAAVVVAATLAHRLPASLGPGGDPLRARLGWSLIGLIGGQVALGFLNWVLLAPTWLQLVHLSLADGCWVALVLFVAASGPVRPAGDLASSTAP
jgi:cytochrome c oxidase assembly protein subunit 15